MDRTGPARITGHARSYTTSTSIDSDARQLYIAPGLNTEVQ